MARTESKSITVAPTEEQEAITKHELFGWTLQSSQEVLSQESHLKDEGGDLWSVTTTTNYVKLVFSRDMEIPRLAEIRKLEEEYWRNLRVYKQYPSFIPGKAILIICGVPLAAGIISLSDGEVLTGLAFLAFSIGVFCARHFLFYTPKKKKAEEALQVCLKIEKNVDEIFATV